MTDPTPDLRDRLVTALGDVQLLLGPKALAMIGRGEAIRLSGNEKDDVADAVEPLLTKAAARGDIWKAKAIAIEQDRDQLLASLRAAAVREQAQARRINELRTVARAAAVLLRATADRPSSQAALIAAAKAIDELTTKET